MNLLLGVGLRVLSSLCFALTYTFYKASLPFLSNLEVVAIQSFLSWLFILPFALRGGIGSLMSPKVGFICLRSFFGLGSAYCLTLALSTTSLAETTLLNNTSPLFIPFLAWIGLKEKIRHCLWPSLIVGFIGVVIVLHPTTSSLNPGLLWALLSGFFAGCLVVAVRHIAHEPLHRILFYYFLLFWIVPSPLLLFSWKTPPVLVWIYLCAAAVCMIGAQLSLTAALRHASPQAIAPFAYALVIFSGIIGWVIWGETVHLAALIGMTLVVISGIYTIFLNQRNP